MQFLSAPQTHSAALICRFCLTTPQLFSVILLEMDARSLTSTEQQTHVAGEQNKNM